MSVYSSVHVRGFGEGPDSSPWCDVAHDHGVEGGRVRVVLGEDFDHVARTFLTRDQARGLAVALLIAAEYAQWEDS